MHTELKFLGAAGTVTGSKFLLELGHHRLLVDCGLFQGPRLIRERNWSEPEFNASEISAVLLTHAHIDHAGLLPRYYSLGLDCPIYCSRATRALSEILLPDSARLQEEEASYRAKSGSSRHHPPLPLYTEADATGVLKNFKTIEFGVEAEILPGVRVRFRKAGHILGAGSIEVKAGERQLGFSGDIGRFSFPVLCDPEPIEAKDLLVLEATYGGRNHPEEDPLLELAAIVNKTASREGIVLIPSFAVGRTQLILYYLKQLKENKKIPDIPIVIDSPMAVDATSIYTEFAADLEQGICKLIETDSCPFTPQKLQFVRTRQESIALNRITDPMILISASGMLTGGRILHHLRQRISSPLNTIVFVGYQPPGSRGAWILGGAESLTLFKEDIPIRAEIRELSGLSAHADSDELLKWCRETGSRPDKVALVHGEPPQAEALKVRLESELGWEVFYPSHGEKLSL